MTVFPFLKPELNLIFDHYKILSENSALRRETLLCLQQFLLLLSREACIVQDQFAASYLSLRFDQNQPMPFHHPLFTQVLGPYILRQLPFNQPPFLRYYLAFYNQFITSPKLKTQLPSEFYNLFNLIEQALQQEPNHPFLVSFLIETYVRLFTDSIHEIPSGVLSGMNGATIEDCNDLLKNLEIFKKLITQQNQLILFQPLISRCQFYFQTYLDYLKNNQSMSSYEQYLQQFSLP